MFQALKTTAKAMLLVAPAILAASHGPTMATLIGHPRGCITIPQPAGTDLAINGDDDGCVPSLDRKLRLTEPKFDRPLAALDGSLQLAVTGDDDGCIRSKDTKHTTPPPVRSVA